MLVKCSATELDSPLVIFVTFDGCLYFSVNFHLLELGTREEEKPCGPKEAWGF